MLAVEAGKARRVPGSRPGRSVLAVTALSAAALLALAACSGGSGPTVTLRIATSSSGVGISPAAAGATDIGASDAYLSPADVTKHVHLVNIPLAVHRSDASGSSFLFTSYLNAQGPADWSPSLIGTKVAWPAQPGGRGADGSDNMISTVGSAAQAYPVINYEYAIVSTAQPSATLAQDLRAFLSWALTSGTAQLGPVNFQPLPASVVTQAQAQIAEITG